MKRIGVLSDTHGVVPQQVYSFFKDCDEIWHAGDLGPGVLDELEQFKPVQAVFGNMDGSEMQYRLWPTLLFEREGNKILMTHIGGYPKHYDPRILPLLRSEKPDIFVCGHSHILKIMYDQELNLLHINPGASGWQGFHKVGTLVRFVLDPTPQQMEVLDFDKYSNT
ncbi:MAG: metallophosphoesterase family protein [Bacteroidales bacterium]|nr:metallophosphoesterase family protein [Bacteroidales bacterium]